MNKQNSQAQLPPTPSVNAGIYALMIQTYALLDDIYNYSATPDGAILADFDYIQQIDTALNQTVSILMDAVDQELREAAQDAVNGFASRKPDNNRKFAKDEPTGE